MLLGYFVVGNVVGDCQIQIFDGVIGADRIYEEVGWFDLEFDFVVFYYVFLGFSGTVVVIFVDLFVGYGCCVEYAGFGDGVV